MYKIKSNNTNIIISLISDIHYSKKLNKNTIPKLLNKLKNEKSDYICIPGDIIDESTDYDDYIDNFFKDLNQNYKVIICLGNHDLSSFQKSNQVYNDTKWYNNLKKYENIHILNNEQFIDNNICFTGITPLFDKDNNYLDNTSNTINILNNMELKTKRYNILLSHSPLTILSDKSLYNNNFINKQNLILCGHMHNGLILPFMDKLYKSNRGLVGPKKTLFPKYAKGQLKINNTDIIICKGITKLAKHSNILKPLNILFPLEVEKIEISNKKTLDN